MKRTGEDLASNVIRMLDGIAGRPQTLVHGDFRADNLFFGGPDGGQGLAAIDWQVSSRGGGAFDLAYFCRATSLRKRGGPSKWTS